MFAEQRPGQADVRPPPERRQPRQHQGRAQRAGPGELWLVERCSAQLWLAAGAGGGRGDDLGAEPPRGAAAGGGRPRGGGAAVRALAPAPGGYLASV